MGWGWGGSWYPGYIGGPTVVLSTPVMSAPALTDPCFQKMPVQTRHGHPLSHRPHLRLLIAAKFRTSARRQAPAADAAGFSSLSAKSGKQSDCVWLALWPKRAAC